MRRVALLLLFCWHLCPAQVRRSGRARCGPRIRAAGKACDLQWLSDTRAKARAKDPPTAERAMNGPKNDDVYSLSTK